MGQYEWNLSKRRNRHTQIQKIRGMVGGPSPRVGLVTTGRGRGRRPGSVGPK